MTGIHSEKRVLVAEDEASVARALADTIRTTFGCGIDIVYNGDEALEALSKKTYDLLVTDMVMPGTHGLDLVRRVRADYPLADIIVSTGFVEAFPYVEVIQAGASDFIVKPYPIAEMHAKVLRLFKARDTLRDTQAIIPSGGAASDDAGLEHDNKYQRLFELNVDGMVIVSLDTCLIQDANQTFCNLANRVRQALEGVQFLDLFELSSRKRLEQLLPMFVLRGQGAVGNAWLKRPDGAPVCVDLSLTFIGGGEDRFVQVTCKDATEHHKVHEHLAKHAQTDQLTGLLNRRMLTNNVDAAIAALKRAGTPSTLLFMDLDDFKQCNDTHGHQTGDELLQAVGQLIQKHIRSETDHGYRYGGDEFAVLLCGANAEIGARVAERIRADYASQDRKATSISIGVAELSAGMDAADFVKAADAAAYASKLAGKNRVSVA